MRKFHVKAIEYQGKTCNIALQDLNGPCQLLSICNYFSLVGEMSIPSHQVEGEELVHLLAERFLDTRQDEQTEEILGLIPSLLEGLYVDVRFNRVDGFEESDEISVFRFLDIPLYHGWLVDPQDPNYEVISKLTYNEATNKLVSMDTSSEKLAIQDFLETTKGQITYHGIICLLEKSEIGILFRNNHFSVFHRENNELFCLVGDEGYKDEDNIVWESVSSVKDSVFCDAYFRNAVKTENEVCQISDE